MVLEKKQDIASRNDLRKIMVRFYDLLLADTDMIPFFEELVERGLEKHFDVLVDFWDNMLFYTGAYRRNAMHPHLLLHRKKPMYKEHFERWLTLLETSAREMFSGPKVEEMMQKARQIATIMEMKTAQMGV